MNRKLILWMAALSALGILTLVFALFSADPAQALPEYAHRTGEPCATCHINPGGGGPRTLRGALWAARGKPEKVPALSGVLLAPGVTDGAELYEIACSTCHGLYGEGMFGRELANSGLISAKIRSNILKGRLQSGMPSFDGKFTLAQLDALTTFVFEMSSGVATPVPNSSPLDPGRLICVPSPDNPPCGGN